MAARVRTQPRTPALGSSAGVFCAFVAMLAPWLTFAQEYEDFKIAVEVNQVVLDVTVYDRQGRLVSGLTPDSFRVLEDGVEQQILHLTQEDRPLTLGLVVDSSRSIGERRAEVIEGAMRLARLSHERDDVFLVSFNDSARIGLDREAASARSLSVLRDALIAMRPEGQTALYDGLSLALDELDRGKWERQAAVVFSDGGDTSSKATIEETLERVRRSNGLVYAIGLASPTNPYRSPKVLKKLARASGGEAYFPEGSSELQSVCEAIAKEMRSQYTLTYAPANPRQQGLYREITVRLADPAAKGWKVRAREGYYEPGKTEIPR
jgi:VWFA-related protein